MALPILAYFLFKEHQKSSELFECFVNNPFTERSQIYYIPVFPSQVSYILLKLFVVIPLRKGKVSATERKVSRNEQNVSSDERKVVAKKTKIPLTKKKKKKQKCPIWRAILFHVELCPFY